MESLPYKTQYNQKMLRKRHETENNCEPIEDNEELDDDILHDEDIVSIYIDYEDPDYDEVFVKNEEALDKEEDESGYIL